MGFWGSFVVCRGRTSVLDFAAIAERSEGLVDEDHWGDWHVAALEDQEILENAEIFLGDLVRETGMPAIAAAVYGSDAIAGYCSSHEYGLHSFALARDAMRGLCEDDDEAFDEIFPSVELATMELIRWAQSGALQPNIEKLSAVLATAHGDPFVEPLFFGLTHALGIEPQSNEHGQPRFP